MVKASNDSGVVVLVENGDFNVFSCCVFGLIAVAELLVNKQCNQCILLFRLVCTSCLIQNKQKKINQSVNQSEYSYIAPRVARNAYGKPLNKITGLLNNKSSLLNMGLLDG